MDILEINFHPQHPFEIKHFNSEVATAVEFREEVPNFIFAAEGVCNLSLHRQAKEVIRRDGEGLFRYSTGIVRSFK